MALAQPRFEQSGEIHIAGLSQRYARDKLSEIPSQWNLFATQLHAAAGRLDANTYGVWYDVLGGGGPMLYVTGVRVGAFAPISPGFGQFIIPPQQYAVFRHEGSVADIRQTVDAIFSQWLPKSGYAHRRQSPEAPDFFERYTETAEGGSVDHVEIWLPVQK